MHHPVAENSRRSALRPVVVSLLAVMLLGAGAWILRLERRAEDDSRTIAELQGELLRSGAGAIRGVRGQSDEPGPATPSATAEPAMPTVAAPPSAAARLAAEYASSPGVRETMAGARRVQLALRYAPLLDQWHLPDDKRQAFLDILLEAEMAETDFGMRMIAATPGERSGLASELRALRGEADSRLRAAIGPVRAVEYTRFNEELPVRTQIEGLATRLASGPEPLTPAQSTALGEVLAIARLKTSALVPPGVNPDTPFTAESGEVLMKSLELANDIAATDAAAVLTASQLEVFRQMQADRIAATQRGLELLK